MYAYLHGFAAGPGGYKGMHLANFFKNKFNLKLHLPDLNKPSFSQLSITNMLAALDQEFSNEGDTKKWNLIGSSMGGYVAAQWASLHPHRVERLILLCPGFDMPARWPQLFGKDEFKKWEETGWKEFKMDSKLYPVHFGLITDGRKHPAYPSVSHDTLIIHGTRDVVVPIETSRRFVEMNPNKVKLVELNDDHALIKSLPEIEELCVEFFSLSSKSKL